MRDLSLSHIRSFGVTSSAGLTIPTVTSTKMDTRSARSAEAVHPGSTVASVIVPGFGQLLRGYPAQAAVVFCITAVLLGCAWVLGVTRGVEEGIFLAMVLILPWWVLQAYDAFLPETPGLLRTVKQAWRRAHDIRYLGGLFLVSALMDLYIIAANPEYRLPVFCTKAAGLWGMAAKIISPVLHVGIGVGFLWLSRWALFVYMVYAGYGLVNATVNYACFGFGRIRTVLVISLVIFTAYILWRRKCFGGDPAMEAQAPVTEQGHGKVQG